MSYSRTSVRILEKDYEAFYRLLQADIKLPPDYRDWLQRTQAENTEFVRVGGMISELTVTPNDFSKYCNHLGLIPTYFNLEVYAVFRSSGN